jgi:DNA polymerase-3 subunit gamma/tau
MRWICREEGIDADDEALFVIAQAGEGSVRDSLSALDQAIACCGNRIDAESVRALLGAYSLNLMVQVTEALAAADGSRMLAIVDDLERNGQNLQHFSRELSRYFRNLLVARIAGPDSRLIAASPREREEMVRIGNSFAEDDLTRYLQIALDLFTDLQTSLQPRFHLEIGLLKMIQAGRLVEIEQALANLGAAGPRSATPRAPIAVPAMAQRPAAVPLPPPRASAPPPPPRTGPSPFELDTIKKTGAPPKPAEPPSVPAKSTPAPDPSASTGDWREKLYTALTELGMAFTADAVEHSQFTQSGNDLLVLAPTDTKLSMKEADLQKAIAHLGLPRQNIKITFGEPAKAGPALEKKKTIDEDEVTTRALSNPEVQRFRELFGGEVRAVRNLKE